MILPIIEMMHWANASIAPDASTMTFAQRCFQQTSTAMQVTSQQSKCTRLLLASSNRHLQRAHHDCSDRSVCAAHV